jgi:hypothetical protein
MLRVRNLQILAQLLAFRKEEELSGIASRFVEPGPLLLDEKKPEA